MLHINQYQKKRTYFTNVTYKAVSKSTKYHFYNFVATHYGLYIKVKVSRW